MRLSVVTSHFSNLLAGLTAGLVTLVYSISFAALIFSGSLTRFFPQGVGTALIGATVTAIIVAWRSPFTFALAGPDSNSAIILALVASSIGHSLNSPATEPLLYPTVFASIVAGTLLTGLCLFMMGRFRLGIWARFIPFPVIGGFLAGTGWLITRSSFKVMTGIPLDLVELPNLMQGEVPFLWLAGLLFAIILILAVNCYKHFLILPSLLFAGIAGVNGLWWILTLLPIKLSHEGWFFKPFPQQQLWQAWDLSTFSQVDWSVLFHQSSTLFSMTVIVIISILLNATGLEVATSKNVDLNQELQANGIANMVSGICGGMVGYLSFNRSLVNYQVGAKSALAATIAGGLCCVVLFYGSSCLSFLPKPIIGGLLLYIGLNLLVQWVFKSWFKFPRSEYILILLIFGIIVIWGFLQGVGGGILIACLLFIYNYTRTSSIKYTLSGKTYQSNFQRALPQQKFLQEQGDSINILVLNGFIFFGTVNELLTIIQQRLEDLLSPQLQFIVFDFRLVKGMDSSAVLSFIKLKQLADKSMFSLVFTQIGVTIMEQFIQGGLFSTEDKICHEFHDLDRGMEWCENRILETNQLLHSPFVPLRSQLQIFLHNAELVSNMMSYLKLLKPHEGEFLFRQGDSSDGVYFLESGQVSVVLELPGCKAKRLRTYNGFTILGEMGLYSNLARSASVITDNISQIYYLSTQDFERIEIENPKLATSFHKYIINLLAERISRSQEELKTLLQ